MTDQVAAQARIAFPVGGGLPDMGNRPFEVGKESPWGWRPMGDQGDQQAPMVEAINVYTSGRIEIIWRSGNPERKGQLQRLWGHVSSFTVLSQDLRPKQFGQGVEVLPGDLVRHEAFFTPEQREAKLARQAAAAAAQAAAVAQAAPAAAPAAPTHVVQVEPGLSAMGSGVEMEAPEILPQRPQRPPTPEEIIERQRQEIEALKRERAAGNQ